MALGVHSRISLEFCLHALAASRRFLATLTATYHRYKLRTFTTDLEGLEDQHAYQALRHTLSELLKVTAATAAAAIQAPAALPAWLIRSQNRHLDTRVQQAVEHISPDPGPERPGSP